MNVDGWMTGGFEALDLIGIARVRHDEEIPLIREQAQYIDKEIDPEIRVFGAHDVGADMLQETAAGLVFITVP